MSYIKCDWCGADLPHIFAGDEVDIHGSPYFCCMQCVELVRKLDTRKKRPGFIEPEKTEDGL